MHPSSGFPRTSPPSSRGRAATRATAALAALAFPITLLAPPAAAAVIPLPVGEILVQAHRGGKDSFNKPENSAALFRLAVASPVVDRIETDVRITKDNKLVIMHDQALPTRCTPFTRIPIHQLTWAELQTVRCEGEPIPALDELFEIVRPDPSPTPVALNLELKIYDGMTSSAKLAFAKQVVAATLASGIPTDRLMLSSWYWRSFAGPVQKYGKGLIFSAIELEDRAQPTDAVFSTIRRAKALGVDAFAGPIKYTNEGLLAFARDYGRMNIGLMGTDGASDLRFALAHGLRNVTNDDPVATRKSLDLLLADVKANPLTLRVTTTPLTAKTVLKKSMAKYARSYPQVIGKSGLVPTAGARQLRAVLLTVTVTGKGTGTVEVAPSGSRVGVDGVRVKIPRGTKTYKVSATPGDGGDLRIRVTRSAKVTVKVIGYERADY